jgi:hypothetical protein
MKTIAVYLMMACLGLLSCSIEAAGKTLIRRAAPGKPVPGPVATGEANKTPWGKTVDGLACRVLVNPTYVIGQPVSAVVEIKNTSKRERHFVQIFSPKNKATVTLGVTGPDGKRLRLSGWSSGRPGYTSMKPIKPGETLAVDLPNIDVFFRLYDSKARRYKNAFARPGEYALTYTVKAARLPKSMVIGSRGGVPLKRDFPDNVVKNMWAGTLVSNKATFKVAPLGKDDLRVHEWGVFTVYPDAKYANIGMKSEWESLPKFFYRQFPEQRLRWQPATWRKPIVYFYSKPHCLRVDVTVTFKKGVPVVWWPCCEKPVDNGGRAPSKKPLFRSLTWSGWLGKSTPNQAGSNLTPNRPNWQAASEYPMPKDCWLTQARLKDATPITVKGTIVKRSAPWMSEQRETERFIFYDGLAPVPAGLLCTAVEAKSVTLKNGAAFVMQSVFVIDRRKAMGKKGVRFGQLNKLGPGAASQVALAEVPEAEWPGRARKSVLGALMAAGLFEAEAEALLKIWDKGFFESGGVTAFYVLPRSEYDRMIAIDIRPKPSELVRVGVALHPYIERTANGIGNVLKEAARLIKQLDSDDWKKRETAEEALVRMGLPVAKLLKRTLEAPPSFEVAERCRRILKHIDASDYLRQPDGK